MKTLQPCSATWKSSTFKIQLTRCLNVKKTKVFLFSTSQMSQRHNLQNAMVEIFNKEQPMERIFEVKVLGMTFNQHLTWRSHINATTQSCYSILKSLRIFRHPLTSNFNNHCHGLHIWQSEKSHSGKNLRSENESALSIDLSGCLNGSFT